MNLPYSFCCIVTSYNNWYCKDCKKGHGRLYVNTVDDKHYCPDCVPDDIKVKSIDINQNREVIEK